MVYSFFKWFLGVFASVVLLSSCARSPAMKEYFFSDISQQRHHQISGMTKILLISTPTAAPSFQSKEMLYVQKPYQLSQFSRHEWASPPSQMLLPLLVQRIQNTGDFYAVVSSPYAGLADLRLDVRLMALYQEFQGKSSQVVLEVQVELMDVTHARLIKSRPFCVRVDAPENTPYGGVLAANQAVREILGQIALFVSVNSKASKLKIHELPKPNMRS